MFRFQRFKSTSIQDSFKYAMSHMGSQAMVLTSGRQKVDKASSLHGMTISSACSLSVNPTPLLQFNLHLPSYTSSALHSSGYLAIHMFRPSSKSVRLGRIFANGVKRPSCELLPDNDDGELFHEKTTPFQSLEDSEWSMVDMDDIEIPILNEAYQVFICKKRQVYEIDQHEIWVVQVLSIKNLNGDSSEGGLIYYNRNFHCIGDKLN